MQNKNTKLVNGDVSKNQFSLDFYLKFWNIEDKYISKQVVYEHGTFFDVYTKFKKNNADLMYARDFVVSKKKLGMFHPLFRLGSNVREGILYNPSKPSEMIWIRNSIASLSEENLLNAYVYNKSKSEYYPKNIEEYLSRLKKDEDYIIVDDFSPVKINKIPKDYRMKWLFRDRANLFKDLIKMTSDSKDVKIFSPPKYGVTITDANNFFSTQMYISGFSRPGVKYLFIGGGTGKYDRIGNYLGIISDKSEGHQ